MSEKTKGHGHVTPNADGFLARCGGPSICKVCKAELAALKAQQVGVPAAIRYTSDGELAECPCCGSLDVGGAHDTVNCYGCGLQITKPRPLQNAADAWNTRTVRAAPVVSAEQQGVALADSRIGRIYVAGPMTGFENYNFPAFNAQAEALRALGHHVENPADHGVIDGAEWDDYLRYDIGRLATCEAIFLLPGWAKSRGARLEVHIAEALGMTFIHHADAERAEGQAPAPSTTEGQGDE